MAGKMAEQNLLLERKRKMRDKGMEGKMTSRLIRICSWRGGGR
jgi:hypothetical protein